MKTQNLLIITILGCALASGCASSAQINGNTATAQTNNAAARSPVKGRGLASLSHFNVAVAVPDVNATVEWYERVLGFRRVSNADISNGASFAMVERNGVIIEFLTVPNQQPMPMLNQDPPEHIKYLGIKNFCLWVDDMDQTMNELRAHNVRFVWEARELPEVGTRVTMIRDNNDQLIAFWERHGRVWEDFGRP